MRSLHSVRATFLAPLHPHLRTRLALLCFTRARVRAFGLTLNTSTCACVCVQRRLACSSTVSTTSSLSESAFAPPCSGSAARSTRWMCSRRSAGASRQWTRCCGTMGWRRWKRRRRCRARLSSESRTISCLPRTVVCQGQLSAKGSYLPRTVVWMSGRVMKARLVRLLHRLIWTTTATAFSVTALALPNLAQPHVIVKSLSSSRHHRGILVIREHTSSLPEVAPPIRCLSSRLRQLAEPHHPAQADAHAHTHAENRTRD